MKSVNRIIIVILSALFLTCGCSPVADISKNSLKPVPAQYRGQADTNSTASVPWRSVITDHYLVDLIDTALKNSPDVQAAYQRILGARSNVLLNKSLLLPTVNGTVSSSLRKFGLYTMDGAGNISTEIEPGKIVPIALPDYFAGLQSTWEVDIWGKLRSRKKAATARFFASVEAGNMVRANLIAEIGVRYYELLALDKQVEIIDKTIKIQQDALSMVKIQKEAGVANELAVKQFETQLLNLRSLRYEVSLQIIENENAINTLSGRYAQPVLRTQTELKSVLPQVIRSGVPSQLLANRPDIRRADLSLKATGADVKAARAAFYPSLNITGSAGFEAFKTSLLFTTPESIAYGIFGNLAAPLLNRRAIKAQFNLARANQAEALYNYQKTVLTAYNEVNTQMARINALQNVYDLKSEQAAMAARSVAISTELFKTGMATYLEVLVAQQNSLQAQLELIDTRKHQLQTTINIYKALGGGWR